MQGELADHVSQRRVAERVKRQDILYQPGRTIEVMLGEAALWNTPSTVDTLLGQLDRLISFAELPSLKFAVYGNEFVLVETLTGEQRLDDPDEVAVYLKAFDQLRDASATGPDMV
ncbi:MAG: Scr1 family TA system antitoxin-like transcriptional regulator, partial [Pseudonocardiaceae bacterium]